MTEQTRSQGRGKSGIIALVVAVVLVLGGGFAAYRFVLYPRQVTALLTGKYTEMDAQIGKLDLDGLSQAYLTGQAAQEFQRVRDAIRTAKGVAAFVGEISAQSQTTVKTVKVRGTQATVEVERTLKVGASRLGDRTVISTETHTWQKSDGEWRISKVEGDSFSKLLEGIPLLGR